MKTFIKQTTSFTLPMAVALTLIIWLNPNSLAVTVLIAVTGVIISTLIFYDLWTT